MFGIVLLGFATFLMALILLMSYRQNTKEGQLEHKRKIRKDKMSHWEETRKLEEQE